MAIEIVSFPNKNGGSFYSYVSLPDGRTPFNSQIAHFYPSFSSLDTSFDG